MESSVLIIQKGLTLANKPSIFNTQRKQTNKGYIIHVPKYFR
jgi:hypothetical protein